MAASVVVGLSGGVDSSTAAALLLEAGYEVIGVTMRHLPGESTNSCCSLEAIVDARRVAKRLGMPHFVVDVEQPFYEKVILPFEEAYLHGLTPNPCALCNRNIKFGAMWDWAKAQGADYLATGHYVRLERDGAGEYALYRARDHRKDQSYLLYTLTQEDMAHLLFPLGTHTKEESRSIAGEHALVTAEKAESQELCFVPKNDYQGYLREHRPEAHRAGAIRDTDGRVVGTHEGIAFYTIGQRRGLGVQGNAPHYVVALDPEHNEVIVGGRSEATASQVQVAAVNYLNGRIPDAAVRGYAKIRYNMEPAPALWVPRGAEAATVQFDDPQWAVSPGQVAVLYDETERLLGGGRIQRT